MPTYVVPITNVRVTPPAPIMTELAPGVVVGGDASWSDNDPSTYTQSNGQSRSYAAQVEFAIGDFGSIPDDVISVDSVAVTIDVSGSTGGGATPVLRTGIEFYELGDTLANFRGYAQFSRATGAAPQTFNLTQDNFLLEPGQSMLSIFTTGATVAVHSYSATGWVLPWDVSLICHRFIMTVAYTAVEAVVGGTPAGWSVG